MARRSEASCSPLASYSRVLIPTQHHRRKSVWTEQALFGGTIVVEGARSGGPGKWTAVCDPITCLSILIIQRRSVAIMAQDLADLRLPCAFSPRPPAPVLANGSLGWLPSGSSCVAGSGFGGAEA